MGDECPMVRALVFMKCQKIETVHEGQQPNLFDNCTDTSLHILLLKSSMVQLNNNFLTDGTCAVGPAGDGVSGIASADRSSRVTRSSPAMTIKWMLTSAAKKILIFN